ncbi:hypothetical protein PSYMO_09079 [Pseudomonas amygdali pv. mori str. 301020]|uniref:Uncharacterized protein n=1 Tax=Pseudomonas amygdali pv. mori str. 301020 TaxID=629261 RepID=A0A656G7B1_PSEA0|nr:hypothetical protein PSYMO_09079 [Pseudomonas amygdali pv. mori str. 301020]
MRTDRMALERACWPVVVNQTIGSIVYFLNSNDNAMTPIKRHKKTDATTLMPDHDTRQIAIHLLQTAIHQDPLIGCRAIFLNGAA